MVCVEVGMMIPKYQTDLYLKMLDGIKRGEMMIISTGRQTGKSMLNKYFDKLKLYENNLCKEIFLPMQPEPKYKFSRAKWYVAEFNWKDYDEVTSWCEQHFGPHPNNPDAWSRWHHRYSDMIHFRDEKDYNWFVLRWS